MNAQSLKILERLPEPLLSKGMEKREALLSAVRRRDPSFSIPPPMAEAVSRVFAVSAFVATSLIRDPGIFMDLVRSGDLKRSYAEKEYAAALRSALSGIADEAHLASALRRIRCREMVRIAWRDLLGAADLHETMADLTRLAEAVIDGALRHLHRWQCARYQTPVDDRGRPQLLVVIGMGKLGGKELNFSSDVDLIFAFPEAGATKGARGSLGNDLFFSRLCQKLIRVLGSPSADGFVFRVDTRLRPDGENGPLVMSFDNMEQYYQTHGREWERYAWIKARPVAGDVDAGRSLIRRLRPFVYRRYLDYGMFEALRDMKRNIAMEVRRKKLEDDIKIGPGGIREIEFFGQVFQLIRGGVIPALQARGILEVLQVLSERAILSERTSRDLIKAYVFLRITENRLQEFSDQQVHGLPRDAADRLRLAVSMGFDRWDAFIERLDMHRRRVHAHFQELLQAEETWSPAPSGDEELSFLGDIWRGMATPEQAGARLAELGFSDPGRALRLLEHLRNDAATRALSTEGRRRLDRLMPRILQAAAGGETPLVALGRACDLIRTVQRRTSYLALLLENPPALTHLMNLINASPWIGVFLKQHPVLLDELLDPRVLYAPPRKAALKEELEERLARVDPEELEYQIETLCIFKQVNVLRVAASDITGVLPLMRVSDHLTEIAEVILEQVLELAWRHLTAKHGRPQSAVGKEACDRGFAVIAYGKLGGIELGYRSDLDLVFLHAAIPGQTDGKRPVDNTQFFTRLGQRVVHILTAVTRAGVLYDIDMRLRPSGHSGVLVSSLEAFRAYQLNHAWTWEHQALVRARAVGGDPALVRRFEAVRKEVLGRPREAGPLKSAVRKMRERMRRAHLKPEPGVFDLKEDRGGMVDVEFIVQFLVLRHAHRHPEILDWTDNVRLLQSVMNAGGLPEDRAYLLRKAFLVYRASIHRLNLQEKPARVPADRFLTFRKGVQRTWDTLLWG